MFYNVEITFQDNIIHKKTYSNLSEMAEKLGIKYQTCADISSGRMKPKFISETFPFQPQIKIEKTKLKEKSIDII
tara:strand:- start:2228 stop:2452 length:225 start_codon:yes stop_codon:yes gene_type:complete